MQTNFYPYTRLNMNLHAPSQYRVQILLVKVDVYPYGLVFEVSKTICACSVTLRTLKFLNFNRCGLKPPSCLIPPIL